MSKDSTEIERGVLQFLCTGGSGTQLRKELISRLRGYRFQNVEHQVLFDCLQAIPLHRPELIRELLPVRLVRAGFPDFDLERFVNASESGEMNEAKARRLYQELTGGAGK